MKARAFIEAEESGQRNVSCTCELLEVSKAAYYQARKAVPGRRACSDAQLLGQITQVHLRSKRTYGSPRFFAPGTSPRTVANTSPGCSQGAIDGNGASPFVREIGSKRSKLGRGSLAALR